MLPCKDAAVFLLTQETRRNRGTKPLIECECTRGATHRGNSWVLCFGSVADQNLIPGLSDFLLRGSGSGKVLERVIYSCQGALIVFSWWIYWTTMNTNSAPIKTKKQLKCTLMLLLASIIWKDEHPLDSSGWQQNSSFGSGFITGCGPPDQMHLLCLHFYCLQTGYSSLQRRKSKTLLTDLLTDLLTYLARLWPVTSAKASQPKVKHHSLNTEKRGNLPTSWAGLEPVNAHGIYKFGINAFIC